MVNAIPLGADNVVIRMGRLRPFVLCLLLSVSPSRGFLFEDCTLRGRTRHKQTWVDRPSFAQHDINLKARESARKENRASTHEGYRRKQCVLQSTKHDDWEVPGEVRAPLAVLFLSQLILFIGVGAVIPAIPLYGQEIGLSQAANGIVISAPAVALLLFAKLGGNFADFARKPAMLIGMAVIAVSDIGTAFSTTLPALVVARLGLGAGRCLAESGERGMLADLANKVPTLRGRALATQQALVALGISIGAPLGGIVIEEYGPRASFLCVSAGALIALLLYTALPETVEHSDSTASSTGTALPVPAKEGEWQTLLQDDRWKATALCQCGTSFGYAAKIASIPILATQTLPGGAAGAGVLLSVAGLSGLVGAPIGGWLSDQVGPRVTSGICGLVSALGLLLIPVALDANLLWNGSNVQVSIPFSGQALDGTAAAFAAVVVLWSMGATAQGPALTALAQELAPKGCEATALALPRAAGDGTYIMAPFLLGAVADASWTATGAECAVAGLVGILGASTLLATNGGSRKPAGMKSN